MRATDVSMFCKESKKKRSHGMPNFDNFCSTSRGVMEQSQTLSGLRRRIASMSASKRPPTRVTEGSRRQ
ncbi:MAG: hypothetical protein A2Y14_00060 [Verrucomicrobia bacterium GWF2_51_19]|nr:MAG: hypothetical protein A2Y14_00060 [Verrucomicrobia bacterium GWF2_51_19]HCJ11882.1 hypothetical protein [Opitutae bacterium]